MDLRRTQETQKLTAVRLREAIKTRLGPDRVEWLAGELGVNGTTVLRWLEGPTAISLAHVVAIEDALGLPRGDLLRAAGYVDASDVSLEQMISYDSRLTLDQRSVLLQIVDEFVSANLAEPKVIGEADRRAAYEEAATTLRAARKKAKPRR